MVDVSLILSQESTPLIAIFLLRYNSAFDALFAPILSVPSVDISPLKKLVPAIEMSSKYTLFKKREEPFTSKFPN